MKLAILTTLLAGASAFTVPTAPTFATKLAMSEEAVEAVEEEAAPEPEPEVPSYTCISKEAILASPNTIEIGSVWDPLGLADIGSDETLAWYRHAEVSTDVLLWLHSLVGGLLELDFVFQVNCLTDLISQASHLRDLRLGMLFQDGERHKCCFSLD